MSQEVYRSWVAKKREVSIAQKKKEMTEEAKAKEAHMREKQQREDAEKVSYIFLHTHDWKQENQSSFR